MRGVLLGKQNTESSLLFGILIGCLTAGLVVTFVFAKNTV